MAYDYFSADIHFGHSNIIGYCGRPYKDAEEMNAKIIANINERCTHEDTLYHVGDFLTYGRAKGVEGMRNRAHEYEARIIPKVVHIRGNHDKQGKLRVPILGAFMQIGPLVAWVQHKPPVDRMPCDFYICGHVHEKWQSRLFHGKIVINVGVDVWNYRPVRKDEIIALYERLKK